MLSEYAAVACETYRVFVRDYVKVFRQLLHIHLIIYIYSLDTDSVVK
jgi:hypothetical protein